MKYLLVTLILLSASTAIAQPPSLLPIATPTPFDYSLRDKCQKEYTAFTHANRLLNEVRDSIRGLPRPVTGAPPPVDATQDLIRAQQDATARETRAAMTYEQARAVYMTCEQGGVK